MPYPQPAVRGRGSGPAGSGAPANPLMHYDTFDDTYLTLLTDHTPNVGGAYAMESGVMNIENNPGTIANAVTLAAGYALAYILPPRVVGQIHLKWRNANQFAKPRVAVFRLGDINNYFFVETYCFGNDIKLIKRVAAGNTTLDQDLSVAGGIAQATWYWLWVDIVGDDISVYHSATSSKPGAPLLTANDSALNLNKTCGFYAANTVDRWDDFTVYDSVVL